MHIEAYEGQWDLYKLLRLFSVLEPYSGDFCADSCFVSIRSMPAAELTIALRLSFMQGCLALNLWRILFDCLLVSDRRCRRRASAPARGPTEGAGGSAANARVR